VDCYIIFDRGIPWDEAVPSLVRLSEALARPHCDDLVRPSYARESFRLLRKSIIHVETDDVTFDEGDDFDDEPPEDYDGEGNEGDMDDYGGQQGNEDDAQPTEAAERLIKEDQDGKGDYSELTKEIALDSKLTVLHGWIAMIQGRTKYLVVGGGDDNGDTNGGGE